MKKNLKNCSIISILLFLLMINILKKEYIQKEFINYTILFFKTYVPSSFIFITISTILLDYNFIEIIQKITKKNSVYLYLFFITAISGFPSASINTKKLLEEKMINQEMAKKMLWYSHFPNPLFVINNISMILSTTLSIKILLSILLSNLCLFLFIPKTKKKIEIIKETPTLTKSIQNAINHAIKTIILIYGISIFFSFLSTCISIIANNNIYLYVLTCGIFDLTKGVNAISLLSNNILKSYYALLFISLGSISIHMQTKSILSDTTLYHQFLLGRIISTMISIILFSFMI